MGDTLALICLPVCLVACVGWHAANTGRRLPVALLLAGIMLPFAAWFWYTLGHVLWGFPGILGLSNLCILPILKKQSFAQN